MAGMTNAWGVSTYDPNADLKRQMAQADVYGRQADAQVQAQQAQMRQTQAENNQLAAQRTALNRQNQMLSNSDQYLHENTGLTHTMTSGGPASGGGSAGSGRATSGFSVGGGVYPNVTDALALLKKNTPQAPAKVPAPAANSTLMSESFANAKDIAGRQGNKALEQLRNEMTRRGISDSGIAMEGEANILGNVARGTSQAAFGAAMDDNAREWNARQLGYTGGVQQRSQDIGMYENDLDRVLRMILQLY